MERSLTPKQEAFCHAYIETSNASEAYRRAYNAEKMKPSTIHRMAHDVLENRNVTARIKELQSVHIERHKLTVYDLINELEEARKAAMAAESPQTSAAVSATMGKAKLLGLDKFIIDNISSDGSMATKPTIIQLVPTEPKKKNE